MRLPFATRHKPLESGRPRRPLVPLRFWIVVSNFHKLHITVIRLRLASLSDQLAIPFVLWLDLGDVGEAKRVLLEAQGLTDEVLPPLYDRLLQKLESRNEEPYCHQDL